MMASLPDHELFGVYWDAVMAERDTVFLQQKTIERLARKIQRFKARVREELEARQTGLDGSTCKPGDDPQTIGNGGCTCGSSCMHD